MVSLELVACFFFEVLDVFFFQISCSVVDQGNEIAVVQRWRQSSHFGPALRLGPFICQVGRS